MEDLISVVIPVYKVENYIEDCLNSVINQTYKKLEIILVDDGSPDKCGEICSQYKELDNRIKVIHKKNGGLSDARNKGIELATGKYIMFIDSDDFVEMKIIEKLYNVMVENDLDIVCCNNYYYHNENSKKVANFVTNNFSFTKDEAFKRLVDDKEIKSVAWGKLFKKEYFNNVRFPFGKLFEDISTTYKVFDLATKFFYISEPLYYYRIEGISIIRSEFTIKKLDELEAYSDLMNYLNKHYPKLMNKALSNYVRMNMGLYNSMILSSNYDNKVRIELQENIKKNIFHFLKSDYKIVEKAAAIVWCCNFHMYEFFVNKIKMKNI